MEVFRETLASDPSELGNYVVRPETWRTASDWNEAERPGLSDAVKLYQPVHQRFYLVTASLVCRTRGLPDRAVRPQQRERAAIVIRRVEPIGAEGTVDVTRPESFRESAWCGPETGWVPLDDGLPDGFVEEELPMCPVAFPVERALDARRAGTTRPGRRNGTTRPGPAGPSPQRTLWAALLPVARREEYETAPGGAPATGDDAPNDPLSADPRRRQVETTVLQPLKTLQAKAMTAPATPEGAEGVRDSCVYVLLDLVQFAGQHLPDLNEAIETGTGGGHSTEQKAVWDALDVALPAGPLRDDLGATWQAALRTVHDAAAPVQPGLDLLGLDNLDALLSLTAGDRSDVATSIGSLDVNGLRESLHAAIDALPDDPGARPPDVPAPARLLDGSQYVVRCVYERPRCAPYATRTVSAPSRVFTMASFFDPDAPVRPLKVSLPVDPSVGTLRNTAKGVSFLFSKQLRKQVQRVQDVSFRDLDEGNLKDGGSVSIGMICSLSIPIITICALILLLIIVNLLNIVFWWLPYFKICFPIPTASND